MALIYKGVDPAAPLVTRPRRGKGLDCPGGGIMHADQRRFDVAGGFVDILIFAVLAAVIFFKLFNVLGRRTGNEQPPPAPMPGPVADNDDQGTVLPFRREEKEDGEADGSGDPLAEGLDRIRRTDRGFDADEFLSGARQAFGMILDAFHKGDLEPVRGFLDDEVHRSFSQAIADRDQHGTKRQIELVAIVDCEAIEAAMSGRQANVTVRFRSSQIDVVKDSENRIIAGDPTSTIEVTDIWTFSRDTRARDPNWLLVATRSPA